MDKDFIKAVEAVLATGARVQLKQIKDGSIKAQIVKMEEIKNK